MGVILKSRLQNKGGNMSIDILKEDIKSGRLKNLYLFYGEEDFLKKYYIDSIDKKLLRSETALLNKTVIEGKTEPGQIIEACDTFPVFCDMKMVIVKNSGFFTSKKEGSKKEVIKKGKNNTDKRDLKDQLLDYMDNLPSYTCLVFYEDQIDKRLKIVDKVKKNGLIVEFPYQKPVELVKWVMKAGKSFNKEMDMKTASYFVEIGEESMTELLNEFNKLVMYKKDSSVITISDIDMVCTRSIKSRIFDLMDEIGNKNLNKGLKLLNEMVLIKEPILKILFMMGRQLRQILEMKLLLNQGMSQKDACSKMGINPYVAGKIANQASRYSVNKLKESIEEILKMDVAIKTGKINDRVATEILLCKLAQD